MQVDILVVNCSLFNPTPSLSAMIINHFKMRSNIVSYNLAGMGCSAGVIAVNLAKELLQVSLHTTVPIMLLLACRLCMQCLLACLHAALCCQTSAAAQLLVLCGEKVCAYEVKSELISIVRVQVYPGSRALVVSTENITQNWYFGNERSMLIPNCLFRVGGAALLLSNKYACLTLLQYTDCVPQLILYPMPLQNLQPSSSSVHT